MHYVTNLKTENAAQTREIEALRAGMRELAGYLTSPKFREDPTVQTGDVLLRLQEIATQATAAREPQAG